VTLHFISAMSTRAPLWDEHTQIPCTLGLLSCPRIFLVPRALPAMTSPQLPNGQSYTGYWFRCLFLFYLLCISFLQPVSYVLCRINKHCPTMKPVRYHHSFRLELSVCSQRCNRRENLRSNHLKSIGGAIAKCSRADTKMDDDILKLRLFGVSFRRC
jgi:hypothetical protein